MEVRTAPRFRPFTSNTCRRAEVHLDESDAGRFIADEETLSEEIPRERHAPAQVFGSTINLMLDMHELDGDPRWIEAAERYAQAGIERLYYDGLFRGATDLWYYESELWVSDLVSALVRLHTITQTPEHREPCTAFQR